MKRREFSSRLISLTAGASALVSATCALAQGEPVEGTSYVKLSQPIPMPAGGKIEVVEFFWYGCPHCSIFEPTLAAWQKKLPADVSLRRAPVVFREEPFTTHQKLYYSLEAMDLVDAMQRKVFHAIQVDQAKLDAMREAIIERFDRQMSVFTTSAQLLDDGVIDPRDTRAVLSKVLAVCREADAREPQKMQFAVARP